MAKQKTAETLALYIRHLISEIKNETHKYGHEDEEEVVDEDNDEEKKEETDEISGVGSISGYVLPLGASNKRKSDTPSPEKSIKRAFGNAKRSKKKSPYD